MADLKINRRPAPSQGHITHPKRPMFSIDRFGIVRRVDQVEGAILHRLNARIDFVEAWS